MKRVTAIFETSLTRTLLLAFLIVIIPTVSLGLVASLRGSQVATEKTIDSYSNTITLYSRQLSDKINNVDLNTSSTLLEDDLNSLCSQGANVDLFGLARYQRRLSILGNAQFLEANTAILLPQQQWMVSSQSGVNPLREYPKLFDTLEEIEPSQTLWGIRPSFWNSGESCLSVVRGYHQPTQRNPAVVIEIPEWEMVETLNVLAQNNPLQQAVFFDPMGRFYASDNGLPRELAQQAAGHWQETGIFPATVQQNGREYRLLYETDPQLKFTVGILFDEKEILRPIARLQVWLVVFCLAALLGSFCFVVVLYARIFKPMDSLISAMKWVEIGDLSVRAEVYSDKDMAKISRQFNHMVQQLDEYVLTDYLQKLELKDTQLRFLQSQINPHFLYNSLFSLYYMIENGNYEQAGKMAVYLGKYYQRSAYLKEPESTLAEELQNIEDYLHIISMRFPQRLRYESEIDPRTTGLKIPVLSLQTIVENSVQHGMTADEQPVTIRISSDIRGHILVIEVLDTGAGMGEQELAAVQERIAARQPATDGRGLDNVYMRLRLMYGEEVEMTVEHVQPRGLAVSLSVPIPLETVRNLPPKQTPTSTEKENTACIDC